MMAKPASRLDRLGPTRSAMKKPMVPCQVTGLKKHKEVPSETNLSTQDSLIMPKEASKGPLHCATPKRNDHIGLPPFQPINIASPSMSHEYRNVERSSQYQKGGETKQNEVDYWANHSVELNYPQRLEFPQGCGSPEPGFPIRGHFSENLQVPKLQNGYQQFAAEPSYGAQLYRDDQYVAHGQGTGQLSFARSGDEFLGLQYDPYTAQHISRSSGSEMIQQNLGQRGDLMAATSRYEMPGLGPVQSYRQKVETFGPQRPSQESEVHTGAGMTSFQPASEPVATPKQACMSPEELDDYVVHVQNPQPCLSPKGEAVAQSSAKIMSELKLNEWSDLKFPSPPTAPQQPDVMEEYSRAVEKFLAAQEAIQNEKRYIMQASYKKQALFFNRRNFLIELDKLDNSQLFKNWGSRRGGKQATKSQTKSEVSTPSSTPTTGLAAIFDYLTGFKVKAMLGCANSKFCQNLNF